MENLELQLTRNMLQVGRDGALLAIGAFKRFFGTDNYIAFRKAGKLGQQIGEEDRQKVDRHAYAEVARMMGVKEDQGEAVWMKSLDSANRTIVYARNILFTDQDRHATMITDIERDWDEGRPSKALERLTMSATRISEALRFEQRRQLALALLAAPIHSHEKDSASKRILGEINEALYGQLIMGRIGDPRHHRIFSYHAPDTNILDGLSDRFPDPRFPTEQHWIKQLDLPVRQIAIRNGSGDIERVVPAVYDPREKDIGSVVVKGLQRSLKSAKFIDSPIDVLPHLEDRLGFRLVAMRGGRPLRDRLASQLESFFRGLDNFKNILPDDDVNKENGDPQRVRFRRWKVELHGLQQPLEVIIQSVEDFVPYLYEIGTFDPELGMHNGAGWDLYKLGMVSDVAKALWPPKVYGIDLEMAKKLASYEYAIRLGRKQRIYPSPYPDLAA